MDDQQRVLDANSLFYRAFTDHDLVAMAALWADDVPVSCIHPGWTPLHGRAEVMASWRAILEAGDAPEAYAESPKVFITGDHAYVICREVVGGTFLVATNLFVRRGEKWRMVHHQAGPIATPFITGFAPPDDLVH